MRAHDEAAGFLSRRFDVAQHDLPRARRSAFALEPHLRLRDIGRHVAHDARRMLVEHVRADAGLASAGRRRATRRSAARDVEADHARRPPFGRARRRACAARPPARPRAPRPTDTAALRPCSSAAPFPAAARARLRRPPVVPRDPAALEAPVDDVREARRAGQHPCRPRLQRRRAARAVGGAEIEVGQAAREEARHFARGSNGRRAAPRSRGARARARSPPRALRGRARNRLAMRCATSSCAGALPSA